MKKKSYLIVICVFMIVSLVGVTFYAINNSSDSAGSSTETPKSKTVTLEGVMTCLVPKDTSGPQDLSCAIGLKTDDGKYYALASSDASTTGSISTGQRVSVKGTLASQASKYTIEGVVQVDTIDRL